jgi:molybdopterin/thiamine biosynthesis adenylyltransferase
MNRSFSYPQAFSRNIGWVTTDEQELLRKKRIAIAGMGGVGGVHLLTLTRLGVGAFSIADFDEFEIGNFNRQAGAFMSTLGRPKVEVLAEMALDINPDLDIRISRAPVGEENVEQFLQGADLYVDGLDYFVFDARFAVFDLCERLGIPSVIAGPMGMSVALINLLPGHMGCDEYFGLKHQSPDEQAIRFLVGLAPALLHRPYLVDPSAVHFGEKRGPSTPMACELCAGTAATQALKILLGRGRVHAAPHGLQYDAYRDKLTHTWRPGGYRNPLQQLTLAFARRQLRKFKSNEA